MRRMSSGTSMPVSYTHLDVYKRQDNRRAMKELYEVMKLEPPPMTGKELFQVLYGYKYQFDLEKASKELRELKEKVLARDVYKRQA